MEVYGTKIINQTKDKQPVVADGFSPQSHFSELITLKAAGHFGKAFKCISSNETMQEMCRVHRSNDSYSHLRFDFTMFFEKGYPTLLAAAETNRRIMIEKRRSWINLNETIAHCNNKYHGHRIV